MNQPLTTAENNEKRKHAGKINVLGSDDFEL
jgi:hypothetical protein